MIRRAALVACGLLAALVLAGCTGGRSPRAAPSDAAPQAPASAAPSSARAGRAPLAHIVVIVDENKPAQAVIGSIAAPYLTGLAHSYAQATHYSAVTHPSLPNYLALTSGTTAGITSDCNPPGGRCLDTGSNLAEELDAAGLSWKMYAESMPAPCTRANAALYAVKHNPFLYFPGVTRSAAYCRAHDVPYARFAADLAKPGTLPAFSFISPNLCDDMHSCSVAAGDRWLGANVPRILASPAFTRQRSLLVITFDEGDAADNVVPCVFAGPAARRGVAVATPFTHYSLLRTVEEAWGLPPMTANDAGAAPMSGLLR
jgi:phospholipase C